MTNNHTVSIVIPNWNGAHLLRKHLPAVIKQVGNAQIIVTDDASSDDSISVVQKINPNIQIVKNSKRLGFAGNVNKGVEAAKGEIVVLLNTDVVPESGFLKPLLKHFEQTSVFAVGCLEKSFDKGGLILRGRGQATWNHGFYIHWRGEINQFDTAWVSGGSGAFRKSIWNMLGGMDTLYSPFYWEDIDLSYRALKAGYTLIFEPKSVIGHYHEEGKIKSSFTTSEIKQIAYRNQFTFVWKNLSEPIEILWHILYTPVRLIKAALTGDFPMIIGYCLALLRIPQVLVKRTKASRLWQKRDYEIFHP